MSKLSLLVIDPAMRTRDDQGVQEIIDACRPNESVDAEVLRPAMVETQQLHPSRPYDTLAGVVVMGSAASVHDPFPWLRALKAWLQPIVDGHVDCPLFGICFGHQLIASLAGAPVQHLHDDQRKRLGVEISHVTRGRFLPHDAQLHVVVSHRQVVTALPKGFTTIAQRPGVPIDGLQHAHREIYSVQYHPEAREVFAGFQDMDTHTITPRVYDDGRQVLRAFGDRLRDRLRADAAL